MENARKNAAGWLEPCPYNMGLTTQVADALKARLAADSSFSEREIREVSEEPHRLFPAGWRLDHDTTERFRRLTKFSECVLQPPIVRSHRKLLGFFIVRAKRIIFPILSHFLKDYTRAREEFSRAVVEELAAQRISKIRASA